MHMKKSIYIFCALAALMLISCRKDDSIGGSINSTEQLDITTSEWLAAQRETEVVAQLFDRAGLTSVIDSDNITLFAPNMWSVRRYVRRMNSNNHIEDREAMGLGENEKFTIDKLPDSELRKMGMYIFPGTWWSATIPEEGVFLKSVDGTQEIYVTLDETNTDPGGAYDGGGVAGNGYQYSNFLMSMPKLIHVLFKRGENWEFEPLERLDLGLDDPECDQCYRMYISDIRTKNGVVNIIYMGDYTYSEHYFYHCLFFFGTRNDDQ